MVVISSFEGLCARAKERFDAPTWGGAGSSPWAQLQARVAAWQQRTYGYQPFERMVLGIVEELGEFMEATHEEGRRDAIADITIFTLQLCTMLRLDYGTLRENPRLLSTPWELAMYFSRVALKSLQGIRGLNTTGEGWNKTREAFAVNVHRLSGYLQSLGLSSPEHLSLTQTVAEEVLKRTKQLPSLV